ncbi:MAG: hypothetical protein GY943_03465 [Chloroflexi bacterium]|nr:hypothetical protein [Chloroflexota bacterium]
MTKLIDFITLVAENADELNAFKKNPMKSLKKHKVKLTDKEKSLLNGGLNVPVNGFGIMGTDDDTTTIFSLSVPAKKVDEKNAPNLQILNGYFRPAISQVRFDTPVLVFSFDGICIAGEAQLPNYRMYNPVKDVSHFGFVRELEVEIDFNNGVKRPQDRIFPKEGVHIKGIDPCENRERTFALITNAESNVDPFQEFIQGAMILNRRKDHGIIDIGPGQLCYAVEIVKGEYQDVFYFVYIRSINVSVDLLRAV